MTFLDRYWMYRYGGWNPWTAAVLATDIHVILVAAVIAGIIIGLSI